MSVYSVKAKGWRYDFTLNGTRHTRGWFKTKGAARKAENERREEIVNPAPPPTQSETIQIDMAFLDLVNRRLDHVRAYNSEEHYRCYTYLARGWMKKWRHKMCCEITQQMIEEHLSQRRRISAFTANKDLRYLRATMNYGIRKKLIVSDPTEGIDFFPVEKRVKFVPNNEEIDKVISAADPETQDYLWTIRETMARVSEINRLRWEDVNLDARFVILYTRKKQGGHLTPRKIPMTQKLYEVLKSRYDNRDASKPWVFWHRYWSRKNGCFVEGPFDDRKKLMKRLCEKAGVRYFRFHPLRHAGASLMDGSNVPLGAIQRILGHENRKTTEIYLHSIGDMERDAIAVFERARKKSHTDSHTEKNRGNS
ncbi:tyrosine-type recombinase/integrase [Desulfatitalea tepidiphila]|uniref:tyrosine-type recombinase/integrase n=1 Tax=Desulfatitalea tepidiphila TaxID=1185843 RepID=UPI0006B66C39|nr:site-specific integrase [Desulfatitalea tepidiphila]